MLRRSIVACVIACGSVPIVASAQGQTVPVAPPAAVAQDSAIPLAPVTVAAKKARPNRDALSREELAAKPAANLYDVVMSLRSQWMRGPAARRSTVGVTSRAGGGGFGGDPEAASSGVTAGAVPGTVVYLDGRALGPLTALRTIPAENADRLCYYSLNRAQGKFGLSVEAPVLEVITRSSPMANDAC